MAIANSLGRAAPNAALPCAATVGMAAVIDQLSPEIAGMVRAQAAEPLGSTSEQFAAVMASEPTKWSAVIRQTSIRAV